MIETEPSTPYKSSLPALLKVQDDLAKRRATIKRNLRHDEEIMYLSVFPRLGVDSFIEPEKGGTTIKEYDAAIANGKYGFARHNIEARAGHTSDIRLPIFQDVNTKLPPYLHLKHLLFGPGACGLQATFQCRTLQDARKLHDQLTVMSPIFLAMTAATPIYHATLVDTDTRVGHVAQAVDDRNDAEKGQLGARWGTSPMFLEQGGLVQDTDRGLDSKAQELGREYASLLRRTGIDPVLASYFATVHLRDPLYLEAKDGKPNEVTPEAVHLSLFASFWSHVRLKIPEAESPSQGWRVEFRPMELQPTEFENAAILVFLNLLKQTLAWLGPAANHWMPLELVDENMQRANTRNALLEQKFWFPEDPLQKPYEPTFVTQTGSGSKSTVELTINEIVNGNTESVRGLLPLIRRYLNTASQSSTAEREKIDKYLDFVANRASGKEPSPAARMRRFVHMHPSYKKDSVVEADICYDMLHEIASMTERVV